MTDTDHKKMVKLLVVLGPTATGKSDCAVMLAHRFNGEVISADSRQVYRGLDIGTGKITESEMQGVPHYLLDVASPRRQFTVADFKHHAKKAIANIVRRGKLPIFCGGTGFYIQAVVDGINVPDVPPNLALRRALDQESTQTLAKRLRTEDPERATMIDLANKRRLIRALEIVQKIGAVPPVAPVTRLYDTLFIGLTCPDQKLRERIQTRLKKRLDQGMVSEVERLHSPPTGIGVSWERLDALGLEYRYIAKHLQGELSRTELETILEQKIWQYARRQKTWFKRDKRIQWFTPNEYVTIEATVEKFISTTK